MSSIRVNALSDCEEMIMNIIWYESNEPDLMTITEKVNQKYGKNWKIQTVATFLTRLEKKGWISIYRIGRYSHYKALIDFDTYLREKVLQFLELVTSDNSNEQLFVKCLKLVMSDCSDEELCLIIETVQRELDIRQE